MNLDQLIQIEYAKLCQQLGHVNTQIKLLQEQSEEIQNKILSVSKAKPTFDSAVKNLDNQPTSIKNTNTIPDESA